MRYESKSYVYIILYGDHFIPEELSKILAIKPTRTGLKGEPTKYTRALKECIWEYKLDETDALDGLDRSLDNLVDIFKEKKNIISEYATKNELNIKCYVVLKSKKQENTGVLFNTKFISFIHALSAELEVDIYNE